MCSFIEGKATYVIEINIKLFWNNYWWLPLSLPGDSWLVVLVVVVVLIFSPSIFPSLFSPHLHSDVSHLSLFPVGPLMAFRVRRLLHRALKPLKPWCSDQQPWHHLQAVGNAESHQPPSTPPQDLEWLVCTLKFGKHCSTVHTHTHTHTHTQRTSSLLTHWPNLIIVCWLSVYPIIPVVSLFLNLILSCVYFVPL